MQPAFGMAFSFSIRNTVFIYGDPPQDAGRTNHVRLGLWVTHDGGSTWTPADELQALPGESLFAASNSAMTANGEQIWLGTSKARVLRSKGLAGWQSTQTPLASGNDSSGVFSVAFRDQSHGIAVGGDYRKPGETSGNCSLYLRWRRTLERSPETTPWLSVCRGLGRKGSRLDHGRQQWIRYLL